jgi:hypothetical protein
VARNPEEAMTEDDKKELLTRIKMRTTTCPECEGRAWDGTLSSTGVPVIRFRPTGATKHQTFSARRLLLEEKLGRTLGPKEHAGTTCDNDLCVDVGLLRTMTNSQRIKRAHRRGRMVTMATRIKSAQAARARSKLSDADVLEIRMHTAHRSEMMAKHQISEAYYYMLRKNLFRRDFGTPFSGLFTGLAANQERKRA